MSRGSVLSLEMKRDYFPRETVSLRNSTKCIWNTFIYLPNLLDRNNFCASCLLLREIFPFQNKSSLEKEKKLHLSIQFKDYKTI